MKSPSANPGDTQRSYYQTRYSFDPGRARVWKAICACLQDYVQADAATVLDVGCGYGDFINHIRCRRKLAVDLSPDARRFVSPDVELHIASADNMSAVETGSVDVAFASNLLEHLSDDALERTMKELRRVTKPRATLILLQPNFKYSARDYFDDYTHRKIFTHVSLADFIQAHGFAPMRVVPRFLPMTLKSALPKSYWLTRLYLASPWKPLGRQMLVVGRKEDA
jgi:SAM-dependent methyltransferase